MRNNIKKTISKMVILTFIANTVFSNIMPIKADAAISGTLTYSGTDNSNVGQIIHDGQGFSTGNGSASEVSGINLSVFNSDDSTNLTPTGHFQYFSDANGKGILAPVSEPDDGKNEPKIFVIKSDSGSEFNFKSIYVNCYTGNETKIKVEGFRNGTSTGSVELSINQQNFVETFTSENLTPSIFQNVDEVRITNPYEDPLATGNWAYFGDIEVGDPVVPAPPLTNGVSFSDPSGAVNNDKTQINLGAPSAAGNTFKYLISSDANSVPIPGIGADSSSFTSVVNGDKITTQNGKHIGVVEVDSNGKVVQFSDATAAITNEAPSAVSNITLSDNDNTDGVDGKDFSVGFTVSTDNAVVVSYKIYIYKSGQEPVDKAAFNALAAGNKIPVKIMPGPVLVNSCVGTIGSGVITDSKGQALVGGDYIVAITAQDSSGNYSFAKIDAKATITDDDNTPPTWVATYPQKGVITNNSVEVKVKANESGKAYYVCLPSGVNAPTAAEVKAGNDSNGASAAISGQAALIANTENSISIPSLTAGTDYDVFIVAEDSKGNLQTTASKLIFITNSIPITDFVAATKSATTIDFNWPIANSATGIVLEKSSDSGVSWQTATTGSIGVNSTSAKVTNLSEYTTYQFRLIVTGGQNAGTSNIVTEKTNKLPYVESVSVPASGVYKEGQNLDFTVNYNEPVNVIGTPKIACTIGSTTKYAECVSGSGSKNLIFRYIVQSDDLDNDGITLASSIIANGSTLKNVSNEDANLNLNSIASTSSVFVDGIPPKVTSVSTPSSGTYKIGNALDFTVNFDENVDITQTVGYSSYIDVVIGAKTVKAEYISGAGSKNLVFRYIVQSGDEDKDGIVLGSSIVLNNCTIKDSAGNSVISSLNNVGNTTSILVDTNAPIWASMYPKLGTITKNSIEIKVRANEAGNAYFVCVPKGANQPSALNVKLGQDASGALVDASFIGMSALSSVLENTMSANLLQVATDYDIYVVSEDDSSNLQSSVTKLTATTGAEPITNFIASSKTANTVSFNWSMANSATKIIIEQSSDSGVSFTEAITGNVETNATYAKVIGLSSYTDYMFRLFIIGGQNAGISNIVTEKTNKLPYVESVSVPANGVYKEGQNLDFTVNYNEAVNIIGTPKIACTIGNQTKYAEYVSGSGSKNIVFRYTVQSDDLDNDGITLSSSILANGATLKNTFNEDANLNLSGIVSTASVLVDGISPKVSSVSTPSNGTYKTGDILDFIVNFDENVDITQTGGYSPYIDVVIGTKTVRAEYVSGSGSKNLVFRYTVQNGDEGKDGIVLGSNIVLNNCTIKDSAGNSAISSLNGVGNSTAVLVDTNAPIWASMYPKVGIITKNSIDIKVEANEASNAYFICVPKGSIKPSAANVKLGQDASGASVATNCKGVVALTSNTEETITINSLEVATDYDIYVVSEDNASNLQSSVTKITATTSTEPLTNFVATTKTANTVSFDWSKADSATEIKIEQSLDNGVTWEVATAESIGVNATYAKVTGLLEDTNYQFRLVVTGGKNDGTSNIVIDKTNKLSFVESVAVPTNGIYKVGQNLDFTVNYSEAVNVTGTPKIACTIGNQTKYAEYVSGSGSKNLVFRYRVQSGDEDKDGIVLGSNIVLNNCIIKDSAGNSAISSLNGVGNSIAVLVDTNAPIWASMYPKVGTITKNSIEMKVEANEASNAYFICVPKGSNQPSAENVRLGQDASGTSVATNCKGEIALISNTEGTITVNSLEVVTDYDIYVVSEDNASNLQSSVTKLTATTSTEPLTNFVASTKTANTVSFDWAKADSATEIKIEQSLDNGVTWEVSKAESIGVNATYAKVTGLLEDTNYQFRLVVTGGKNEGISNIVSDKTNKLSFVESVAVPANGIYKVGQNLDFTVNYNEAVNVTGTPKIACTIGNQTKYAEYISGTGTKALIFRYTVQNADLDNDGIEIPVNTLINGGTIKNIWGEDSKLALNNIGNTSEVKVDTVIPTFTSASLSDDRKEITLSFDEDILFTSATELRNNMKISIDGGLTYIPLGDDVSISIEGKKLKVLFANALIGSKIRLQMAQNSLNNEPTNTEADKIETSNLGTSLKLEGDKIFTEINLDERILTLTLDGDTFIDSELDKANFILNNAPNGTSIKEISYVDSTHCTVKLGYDGADFDEDINNFSVKVAASELTSKVAITSSELEVKAIDVEESIIISNHSVINKGNENGKIITVKIKGGQFINNITSSNWTVTNLPKGVTKGNVTRVDGNTVEITLSGNSTEDYNSDINNVTVSCSKAEYIDSTGGSLLTASTGVTLSSKTVDTPSTGSSVNVTMWITLCLMSMAIVSVCDRKRKKQS